MKRKSVKVLYCQLARYFCFFVTFSSAKRQKVHQTEEKTPTNEESNPKITISFHEDSFLSQKLRQDHENAGGFTQAQEIALKNALKPLSSRKSAIDLIKLAEPILTQHLENNNHIQAIPPDPLSRASRGRVSIVLERHSLVFYLSTIHLDPAWAEFVCSTFRVPILLLQTHKSPRFFQFFFVFF
jgi:hypothetical protein